MSEALWKHVDDYISSQVLAPDPVLDAALRDSASAGLPAISVSAPQGKMLHLLARLCGARHILELGTLGGYSTIWLARALPADGNLITVELEPNHARVASANIDRAGLKSLVDLKVGKALDLLPGIAIEIKRPFDFIFIDADKVNIPNYFDWALKLSHRGTVIIVDNVVRKGAVADPHNTDPSVQGVRRLNEMLAAEKRVSATVLQTVGSKGYDGFALILVTAEIS